MLFRSIEDFEAIRTMGEPPGLELGYEFSMVDECRECRGVRGDEGILSRGWWMAAVSRRQGLFQSPLQVEWGLSGANDQQPRGR